MNEDHDKSAILSLLCALGLEAEPIPEASYPTPDLRIQSFDGNVLIEVKSREDDRRLRAMVASPEGTPYGRPSSTLYNCLPVPNHTTTRGILFPEHFYRPLVYRLNLANGSSDGGIVLLKAVAAHYQAHRLLGRL